MNNLLIQSAVGLRKLALPDPLISIHIPKTAGTSFLKSLELIYGKKYIALYYDKFPKRAIFAKAIHGHFSPKELKQVFPTSKTITWMRHPVERIISWYFYWKNGIDLRPKLLVKFIAEKPTLETFASWPEVRFELTNNYFNINDLPLFDFIGFTENYNRDFFKLSKILNWPLIPTFTENKTVAKELVSTALKSKIESYLSTEMEVYEAAKKLFA